MFHLTLCDQSWFTGILSIQLWVSLLTLCSVGGERVVTVSGQKNGTSVSLGIIQTHSNSSKSYLHRIKPRSGDVVPNSKQPSNKSKLKWVKFEGKIPDFAVSTYIPYLKREDYICRPTDVPCKAGNYNPQQGALCHFAPMKGRRASPTFEILVNEDNFERLLWKEGSHGSLHPRSIKPCREMDVFVAKHYYGLGAMSKRDKTFFLPWGRTEYWYWFYSLLTVETASLQILTNVTYDTEKTSTSSHTPQILTFVHFNNKEKTEQTMKKNFTVNTTDTRGWDIGKWLSKPTKTVIHGEAPIIVNLNILMTREKSFEFYQDLLVTEVVSATIEMEAVVPPGEECQVYLIGAENKLLVPFTAKITRFKDTAKWGETTISSVYEILYTEFLVMANTCVAKNNNVWVSNQDRLDEFDANNTKT